jgi:DNA-binding transcriptional LysR family regulator
MKANIDDHLLYYAVANSGSITAAARQLELPKSTVSRRLIQFEESLGIKLFHKTTRKITLTALGETYLERCERVVHEATEARDFLDSVTTKATGELRVTMPADIGIHWLADFLVGFSRRHPDVKLSLDFTGRRLDLIGERFDVAIRAGNLTSSEMVARKFLTLDRKLYASPAYLRESGTPEKPADLASHRFVILEAQSRPRPEIVLGNGKRTERIATPGMTISNSLGVVRAMIVAGGGIGVLPQLMAEEYTEERKLVRILPAWELPPTDLYYVISSRKLVPAKTRLFVEELVNHCSDRNNNQRKLPAAAR